MYSILLASLATLATLKPASAHPHRVNTLSRRGVDLDSYRFKLPTTYKNATAVIADPNIPTLTKRATAQDTATELVKKIAPGTEFRLVESYTGDNGISHFFFKQTAHGIDIDNGDFNVNIGRDGMVFSFGNSFYKGNAPAKPAKNRRDAMEPADALKAAVNVLDLPIAAGSATAEPKDGKDVFAIKQTSGTLSEPEARLVYVQTADGSLALAWRVETDIESNWLLTYVDAKDGSQVHAVVDWSADASYQVYPWGINDPTEGSRVIITDPADKVASEFGWHSTGTESFQTTRGNNGVAQSNIQNASGNYLSLPRPVNKDLQFHFDYSLNESDFSKYSNASITQLFYTSNVYHDLLYKLGFTEKAGNFEINNNGQGGIGNDFVYLNAQDGSDFNNANFATPPDGQTARMRMYMWNKTTPFRDCSFEAGVVIHEYTHGLSNRLTGGPSNSNCLSVLESGGMGEGWSDFYATAIRLKKGDTRATNYGMGEWVNGGVGIRNFPYSTSMTTNPQVYKDVEKYTRVHPIGNIWASILYEVLWNLIDKHGKNDAGVPTFDSNGVPTDGKYLAMKLVLDGLALQPCNPNFVSARDAIIDADKALTGGSNKCELWKAFAKRGLGEGAKYSSTTRTNSFVVPQSAC